MPMLLSQISLLSAVVYTLSFTLTTILHEIAHALVSLALGDRPILHSTFVQHEAMSPTAQAITAAAGPVFSLLQGCVFWALFWRLGDASVMLRLFALWMGLHGLVNFFGYLMTVPFAPDADLGKVAQYLGLHITVRYVTFIIGFLVMWIIGLIARGPFLQLAPGPEVMTTESSRMSYMFAIAVVPWLLGALISVLTRLPSPQWLNIVYPLVNGMFTIITWRKVREMENATTTSNDWGATFWWPWLIALGVILVLFRCVLAPGIRLSKSGVNDS